MDTRKIKSVQSEIRHETKYLKKLGEKLNKWYLIQEIADNGEKLQSTIRQAEVEFLLVPPKCGENQEIPGIDVIAYLALQRKTRTADEVISHAIQKTQESIRWAEKNLERNKAELSKLLAA